jgi:phage baseplate assembly protein W
MHVDYPFSVNSRRRTATTDRSEHIRDLIEQVLFTAQGERVNRPDFGAGVERLVFAPNSDELATATRTIVQGSLQHWLAGVIEVEAVETRSDEGTLEITVVYIELDSGEQRATSFVRDLS